MRSSSAVLSPCRTYRYSLTREWSWETTSLYVLFIGLNPSTADEANDDPTIRRCIGYAKSWNYGGLFVANLFAFRATKPADMKAALEPVGTDNNKWLLELAGQAQITIACWGNDGSFKGRASEVIKLLPQLHCLKINERSGQPAHPLYLKGDLKPILMRENKEGCR